MTYVICKGGLEAMILAWSHAEKHFPEVKLIGWIIAGGQLTGW